MTVRPLMGRVDLLVLACLAIGGVAGCTPDRGATISAPMGPASSTTTTAPAAPPAESSVTVNATTGELVLAREVTFEVRPLNGPGTMGPRVLTASSEEPLERVRAHLASHPDVTTVRVECVANPRTMSGMPDPRWPAGLAMQAARWLVDHGVDCKRLDVVGRLDDADASNDERVRFYVGRSRDGVSARKEARVDACEASGGSARDP